MPRQSNGTFNQKKYINQWQKEHMKSVKCMYRNEFVDSFKDACKVLGISQSQVFKKAMADTIKKAQKKGVE